LTEAAAKAILTQKTIEDHEGNKLSYLASRYWVVLEAMQQFELCYPVPHNAKHYVIPDLLPAAQPPDLRFERSQALRFDFDFDALLPRHVMANFIVRRHTDIVDELVWQNGVRLRSKYRDAQALAKADYHTRRWSLWLAGIDAARYFDELYGEVMQILGRMNLAYSEWVWLPGSGNEAVGKREMPRADFKDLLALEHAGERFYKCKYGSFNLSEVLKIMSEEKRAEQAGMNIHVGRDLHVGKDLITGDKITTITDSYNQSNAPESLLSLLQQLNEALQKAQATPDVETAQAITQQMTVAAKAEKPNSSLLKITGKGLLEAAKAVGGVVPVALGIAQNIVQVLENNP